MSIQFGGTGGGGGSFTVTGVSGITANTDGGTVTLAIQSDQSLNLEYGVERWTGWYDNNGNKIYIKQLSGVGPFAGSTDNDIAHGIPSGDFDMLDMYGIIRRDNGFFQVLPFAHASNVNLNISLVHDQTNVRFSTGSAYGGGGSEELHDALITLRYVRTD